MLTAIPGALTGVLLGGVIEALDDVYWLIGVMLIVLGLVLAWADRLAGERPAEEFRLRDALLMGAGQALALQPGVSRSGVTMTVGRWLGFEREAAVRISFLMSMPIIAGAGLYSLVQVLGEGGIPADMRVPFVVGMVTAGATGWLAVWATIAIVRARSFGPFVVYRIVLGIAVIGLAISGVR
jgi:undecaprenyl-diphosphatase